MRKILIVDDEKFIRLGVKAMIERKKEGFYDVALCSNGREALEIAQKERFDVIITDIRMPQMDGIALIQKLQQIEPKPVILILSGYDDFNYAVEALKCGAKDYLLKPIKREELYENLDRIEKEIEMHIKLKDKEELISNYIQYFKDNELNYIFLKEDISKEEIIDIGRRLELQIFDDSYYLGIIMSGNMSFNDKSSKLREEIYQGLEEYIGDNKCSRVNIFNNENNIIVVAKDYKVFKYLEEKYSKDNFYRLFLSVSEELKGIETVKKAYNEALEAAKYRIFYYHNGITLINYCDILNKKKDYIVSKEKLDMLRNLIETEREKEIEKLLSELLNEKTVRNLSILYAEEISKGIYETVLKEIKFKFFSQEEDMIKKIDKFKSIYNFDDFKEYYHSLKEIILYINEYTRAIKEVYDDRNNMDKAVEYINENYYKDLNLAVVSNEVSLNYSYFSQAFKEYTGETFVNYLKKVRINKAKEILKEGDLKIYEVAKRVGYEDSKQFTKIFRSITGVSPIEYRNSSIK